MLKIDTGQGVFTPMLVNKIKLAPKPALQVTEASDEVLRRIVDACASNVVVLDESASVLYASNTWLAFAKAHGLVTAADDLPAYFQECIRLVDRPPVETPVPTLAHDIQNLCAGNATEFQAEYCYRNAAQPTHLVVHGARLDLASGEFRIFLSYKEAHSSARVPRKSDQRLSQLLEKTRIVVWEADPETWRFTYISEQAKKLFGYSISQLYEPEFFAMHIHPDDRERVLSFLHKHARISGQYDVTFRFLAKNRRVVWVHNLISATHGAKSLRGLMIDITERKHAEEALKDLGGRLITAQEEERSRIARELHDDFNQRMALLSIELEQIEQDVTKPAILRRRVHAVQMQAQEIAADIHQLSYQLHPSKLDHLGLAAAVSSLCEELSQAGKLKVDLTLKGFPADLPGDVTLSIFRVAQESLRNCVKHSGAQSAQVVLERNNLAIRLSVSDNGCGFDAKSASLKQGLGFVSMEERIRFVGGEMNVYSQPERGTRIEVSVPRHRGM
jgi:PAS domain S-box-containing protein